MPYVRIEPAIVPFLRAFINQEAFDKYTIFFTEF